MERKTPVPGWHCKVRSLASLKYCLWSLHISAGKDCTCWSFSNTLHTPCCEGQLTSPASDWENRPLLSQHSTTLHPGCSDWASIFGTSGTAVVTYCYFEVSNWLHFISFLYSFWYNYPFITGTRTMITDISRTRISFTIFGTTQFYSCTSTLILTGKWHWTELIIIFANCPR